MWNLNLTYSREKGEKKCINIKTISNSFQSVNNLSKKLPIIQCFRMFPRHVRRRAAVEIPRLSNQVVFRTWFGIARRRRGLCCFSYETRRFVSIVLCYWSRALTDSRRLLKKHKRKETFKEKFVSKLKKYGCGSTSSKQTFFVVLLKAYNFHFENMNEANLI